MDTEFSNEEACGCGSSQPYVSCCKGAIARYVRDERGAVFKQILLVPEAVEIVQEAREEIERVFGRKPHGRDLLLLAGYRHGEGDFDRLFEQAAAQGGLPKEFVYAHRKTRGLLLTEETIDLAAPADRAEWLAAIDEYLEAEAEGRDLLEPEMGPVLRALELVPMWIENSVIHLGSYAHRAPRSVRRNLPLFLQFLLISRCHSLLKAFADGLKRGMSDEAFALLRSIYECTLLVGRLESDPSYGDALIAQALVGNSLYQYRTSKRGSLDYSRIVEVSTGREFLGRPSYYECSEKIGSAHIAIFQLIYPTLSSHIHFDPATMIGNYRETGRFLSFEESDPIKQGVLALLVVSYLAHFIMKLRGATKIVRRDAKFLYDQVSGIQRTLTLAIEEEGLRVAPPYAEIQGALAKLG